MSQMELPVCWQDGEIFRHLRPNPINAAIAWPRLGSRLKRPPLPLPPLRLELSQSGAQGVGSGGIWEAAAWAVAGSLMVRGEKFSLLKQNGETWSQAWPANLPGCSDSLLGQSIMLLKEEYAIKIRELYYVEKFLFLPFLENERGSAWWENGSGGFAVHVPFGISFRGSAPTNGESYTIPVTTSISYWAIKALPPPS